MPLVRAHFQKATIEPVNFGQMLFWALREIVPAAFNSEQGPLTPGSIEYVIIDTPSYGLNVDCFIEIEAYHYEDRDANLDDRAEAVGLALKELLPEFPACTFAVWPKLVRAGWWSEVSDPDVDVDMSMEAALWRASGAILEHS